VYYRDDDQPVVPDIMIFGEPYPNPSASSVHTTLILPESAETMAVEMVAYNIMGQPVKSIVSASFHGGIHEVTWDGNDFSGSRVPAGMYILRPKVNGQPVNQLHKVILK
jgi:flagellar hook assembly protein FlgD